MQTHTNNAWKMFTFILCVSFYSFTSLPFATAARVLEEVDVLVIVPVLDEETVLVVDKVVVSDAVLLDVVNVAVILVDALEEVLLVVLLDVVGKLEALTLYRNQSVLLPPAWLL